MKLKELPSSLWQLFKLSLMTPSNLNAPKETEANVIVSCTSIPSRLHVVHHTVKSVLNQNTPPKKMVLWLHESAKNTIPTALQRLVGDKFDIRFTELDSPHCKLVPSLKEFPGETIVTCDDDLLYSSNWLSQLIAKHEKFPGAILAYKVRKMAYDTDGKIKAYKDWKYDNTTEQCDKTHIAMGYGGVLYPSDALPAEAIDSSTYMKLCPKADDLWFKAMSYLNETQIIGLTDPMTIYPIPGSQKISLKKTNVSQDKNRTQWLELCKHYPKLNDIAK